jgi:prolyl-tRNA synthetase
LRIKLDDRDETPGYKFNDWEMRGVPVRIEIGPRDVANRSVMVARRDLPGKAGKSSVSLEGLSEHIHALLVEIHYSLLKQAEDFQNSNIRECFSWEEVREAVQDGWALAPLDDNPANDEFIREQLTAKTLNFPLDQAEGEWPCVVSGKPVRERALIGKSY